MHNARFATAADRARCRAMIRTGSRSFHAASLLLPPAIRDAACALYAFCRLSDDAVDGEGGSLAALQRLRARLAAIYAGAPQNDPVDRALADVVRQHHLPKALLDALMEGFAWDIAGRQCASVSDLYAYAARVAGSVGAMMAVLMGARSRDMVARACDLGVAMQLTNIARDVGEDARAGRLYLPHVWLAEAGVDPDAFLAAPAFDPRLARVVERVLRMADQLYQRADEAIARLPASVRPAIFAARLLYAEIGHEVARNGYDSITRRAVTSAARKRALLARALQRSFAPAPALSRTAPLAQTRFLVEAVAATEAPSTGRGFDADFGWVMDLFVDLERRETRPSAPAFLLDNRAQRYTSTESGA